MAQNYLKRSLSGSVGSNKKRLARDPLDLLKQENCTQRAKNDGNNQWYVVQSYDACSYQSNLNDIKKCPRFHNSVKSEGRENPYFCDIKKGNYEDMKYFNFDSKSCKIDFGIAEYDQYYNRRLINFKTEIYVNQVQRTEQRNINLNQLWEYLTEIDTRWDSNWNFANAYDLALELEKLHRHLYIPFSYNEINISNAASLQNRINFLEHESAYRSNRMNQLFNYLQTIVIPSVVDDIKYVHGLSYEKAWTSRARYWFHEFKAIRGQKIGRAGLRCLSNYQKYRRPGKPLIKTENTTSKVNVSSNIALPVDTVIVIVIKDTGSKEDNFEIKDETGLSKTPIKDCVIRQTINSVEENESKEKESEEADVLPK